MTRDLKIRAGVGLALSCFLYGQACWAVEGGSGVYLLGMANPGGAITPPEGFYYQNDIYLYQGSLGGNRPLPTGGEVVAGVHANAEVNLSTFLWSTPWKIGDGTLALSATLPVGNKELSAPIQITGPRLNTTINRQISDDLFTAGDPTLGFSLGWNTGKLFWKLGTSFNFPLGDYQKESIANLSYNRWGTDLSGAMTWLDPVSGLDVSTSLGVTFNGENTFTQYRSGDEAHLEWSVSQYLSKRSSIGLIGYFYKQISGDGGSGAALGEFKGRATAIGATASHVFSTKSTLITTRIKFFHDTSVQNRAKSNSVFLTLSVPISVRNQVL